MSRKLNPIAALLATLSLLSLAACSSTKVNTERDPQANLSQYKTFAWSSETKPSDEKPNASIMDETIKASVEQSLTAKGFQKVPESQADLLLSYSAVTKDNISYGARPGYWTGWGPVPEVVTKEGSLTLVFVDPKTHRTVWQGTATEVVGEGGQNQKEVADSAEKILEKYPSA